MPEEAAIRQSLAKRLVELTDIASVSGDESAITSYLRDALPEGFRTVHDHDTVLVAAADPTPGVPTIVLAGHSDTVPLENNFPSSRTDGVIHGRGTADMKAGLAVMLEIAHWWAGLALERRVSSGTNLALVFFGREELSQSHNPLPHALQQSDLLRSAALAVLMEPTGNSLQLGCVGNLNLTLRFAGEAAHSARPWLGENAAHKAASFVHSAVSQQPVASEVSGLTFYETETVTAIRSGTARNVVPSVAEIDINIRYSPASAPEEVERDWHDRINDAAEMEVVGHARSAPAEGDHPLVRRLHAAVGGDLQPKQAWTNVADFAALSIPAVNFGPGDPAFAHRQDEQVEEVALEVSYRSLQKFLLGDPE